MNVDGYIGEDDVNGGGSGSDDDNDRDKTMGRSFIGRTYRISQCMRKIRVKMTQQMIIKQFTT